MQGLRRRAVQLGPVGAHCFALSWLPAGEAIGSLLLVPPLAEELNKTRRALALSCAAFAQAGFSVLQLDLYGCGDSQGEFEEASWQRWRDDVAFGLAWLREQHGGRDPGVWGVRAGCLLASEWPQLRQLWWQPSLHGKSVMQQWLRLQLAAGLQGGQRSSVSALRSALTSGELVELGGYRWCNAIAGGLEAASLQPPNADTLWLEASRQQPPSLLPASELLLGTWSTDCLQSRAIDDSAPWAAVEIEDCPAFRQASLDWLLERARW